MLVEDCADEGGRCCVSVVYKLVESDMLKCQLVSPFRALESWARVFADVNIFVLISMILTETNHGVESTVI